MSADPLLPAPYRPRQYQQLGRWIAGPLQLKAYGITWRTGQAGPPEVLHRAARRYVADMLPAHADAEGHHGLGFVVLHEGQQGSWLLMDWWAHSDICCQLLAHADAGCDTFRLVQRPLLACVWEAVVLSWERDAWVRTMLTAAPHPEAYLGALLPSGAH